MSATGERPRSSGETVLILGGAGMVGAEVAKEIGRTLRPAKIVISALTKREVDEAVESLREPLAGIELTGAAGDLFVPQALQGVDRSTLFDDPERYDLLFDEIFSPAADAYSRSALAVLISAHGPSIVVDCINTATAISYQDAFTVSRRTKLLIDELEGREGSVTAEELAPLIRSVRELLIAQGVPQITRHILFLHRALQQSGVRAYVKVGTTGTGGMGINIPYTHSEDKPSPQLLSKSAIGFAHTGLLFLLARTPGANGNQGTIVKEVKPGAMIGFKRLGETHVRLQGPGGRREPGYLWSSREETLGDGLLPLHPHEEYGRHEGRDVPVRMVGADTGENGFFSIGEFQAITYPQQMEYVTPEEVARTVVLELLGASTGRDVLSAIDGAITDPSYRAGVLRAHALREMDRLEAALGEGALPSIAVGHLGPPRLTKLLVEAWLIRAACGTDDLESLRQVPGSELQSRVEAWLASHPDIVSLITTIGIPFLRTRDGENRLTRGPRINIPPSSPGGGAIPLDSEAIETWAEGGWADMRRSNFEVWSQRLARLAGAGPDIANAGSAALDLAAYPAGRFIPGEVVGWMLSNELDESGMPGYRLF